MNIYTDIIIFIGVTLKCRAEYIFLKVFFISKGRVNYT